MGLLGAECGRLTRGRGRCSEGGCYFGGSYSTGLVTNDPSANFSTRGSKEAATCRACILYFPSTILSGGKAFAVSLCEALGIPVISEATAAELDRIMGRLRLHLSVSDREIEQLDHAMAVSLDAVSSRRSRCRVSWTVFEPATSGGTVYVFSRFRNQAITAKPATALYASMADLLNSFGAL